MDSRSRHAWDIDAVRRLRVPKRRHAEAPREAAPDQVVEVALSVDPGRWHRSAWDRVLAEVMGDGCYRLADVPLLAFGHGVGDVVEARASDDVDVPVVVRTVEHAGHGAYRLFVSVRDDAVELLGSLEALASLGCECDHVPGHLVAVDVPPDADREAAYRVFERGERHRLWFFEEAYAPPET